MEKKIAGKYNIEMDLVLVCGEFMHILVKAYNTYSHQLKMLQYIQIHVIRELHIIQYLNSVHMQHLSNYILHLIQYKYIHKRIQKFR